MKKMLLMLLFSGSLLTAMEAIKAENIICESDEIRDVLHHVYDTHDHKEVLVVFDIDNTVAHVEECFGGDEWFSAMVKRNIDNGEPINAAVNGVLPTYLLLQKIVWLAPVQKETPSLIRFLQTIGTPVIALTSRSSFLRNRTVDQLKHIGVDFSINDPLPESYELENNDPDELNPHHEHGIIFNGSNCKGTTLVHLMQKFPTHPKKIIFVDDKEKYIGQVAQATQKADIPYVGIRYSRLDQKAADYTLDEYESQVDAFLKRNSVDPTLKKVLLGSTRKRKRAQI